MLAGVPSKWRRRFRHLNTTNNPGNPKMKTLVCALLAVFSLAVSACAASDTDLVDSEALADPPTELAYDPQSGTLGGQVVEVEAVEATESSCTLTVVRTGSCGTCTPQNNLPRASVRREYYDCPPGCEGNCILTSSTFSCEYC